MLTHERRFLASVIDIGIVTIISIIIALLLPKTFLGIEIIFFLTYFVIGFIYMYLSLLFTKNRTIGIHMLSLKMLGDDWCDPDKKAILIRSLTNGVPVLYGVNILYMLLNRSDRTFFDELTNSFIVTVGDTYKINGKSTIYTDFFLDNRAEVDNMRQLVAIDEDYKRRFALIRRALNELDPICVICDYPYLVDEYDLENYMLLTKIDEVHDIEELAKLIGAIFLKTTSLFCGKQELIECANKIMIELSKFEKEGK